MAEQHDATLMVQLAQWGSTMGLEEGLHHVMSDDYDAATAPDDDPLATRVLTFFETVGTLTKNGLLDTALVLDWLWVAGIWAKLAPAVQKLRDKHGVPQIYENFEALASQQG